MSLSPSSSSSSSSSQWELEDIEKKYAELKSALQCPVCLDTFVKPVKILTCLHSFCGPCIHHHLDSESSSSSSHSSSSRSCPLCRRAVTILKDGTIGANDNLIIHSQLDQLASLSAFLDLDLSDSHQIPEKPAESLEISPESQTKRIQTTALIDLVEPRRVEIETSISLIEKLETKIAVTSSIHKDRVISSFEDLKKKIDQQIEERKNTLFKELEEKTNVKLEKLGFQRKQLERDLECLDNSVAVSRSIVQNANDTLFSQHSRLINDQLRRLSEDKNFTVSPVETRHLELLEGDQTEVPSFLGAFKIIETQSKEITKALSVLPQHLRLTNYASINTSVSIIENPDPQTRPFIPVAIAVDKTQGFFFLEFSSCEVRRYTSSGIFDFRFAGRGKMGHKLDEPRGIAIDKLARVIVADTKKHRIQVFNEKGVFQRSLGGNGTDLGEFDSPHGVGVSEENNIVVVDTHNHRIQIFNQHFDVLVSFGYHGSHEGEFNRPYGITIDQLDRIIITDSGNNRVQIFDMDGNHILSFGSSGSEKGQFNCPTGVAVDNMNNILVADSRNNRIQVFDENGNFLAMFGRKGSKRGQFLEPRGLAVDKHNRVLVCDSNNNRIQIFG